MKFQADVSVNWRKWPFSVTCPSCGDVIDYYWSAGNDADFDAHLRKADYGDRGIVIGYCGGLPTPEPLYYKEGGGPGFFSTYLILHQILGLEPVEKHKVCVQKIDKDIIRYQSLLTSIYRMLRGIQTNPKAISKKIADILGFAEGEYHEIESIRNCYFAYDDMVNCVRKAISYSDSSVNDSFDKFFRNLVAIGPQEIANLAHASWQSDDLRNRDTYEFLFSRINSDVEALQILLPAFILDQNIDVLACRNLYLVTASVAQINDMYENNYVTIAKFLPFLMGLYNRLRNGDFNTFKDEFGTVQKYNLSDYLSLSDGKKVEIINKIPELRDLLEGCLINNIRNGESHKDYSIDNTTQTVTYRNFNGVTYTDRLINVAHKSIKQLRVLCNLAMFMIMVRKVTFDNGYPE